ncbi:hypothetical protein EVAR_71231_1, partial [Eumeta japonica]
MELREIRVISVGPYIEAFNSDFRAVRALRGCGERPLRVNGHSRLLTRGAARLASVAKGFFDCCSSARQPRPSFPVQLGAVVYCVIPGSNSTVLDCGPRSTVVYYCQLPWVSKGLVTRALIKNIVLKSLAEMGYKCPEGDLDKFVRTATPVSSYSSNATSPKATTPPLQSQSQVHQLKERSPPPRRRRPIESTKQVRNQTHLLRSLNKYLIDNKIKFHTYALAEKRKAKASIRSIPADFDIDEIKSDLLNQEFLVQLMHRLCRHDGSPLWLMLAIRPRTDEFRLIFGKLSK